MRTERTELPCRSCVHRFNGWHEGPCHFCTANEPNTTWLGDFSPYTCKHCGYHVDSRTKYCPECGRKAVHNVDESDRGKSE